jgi:hypothetical protein
MMETSSRNREKYRRYRWSVGRKKMVRLAKKAMTGDIEVI